MVIPTGSKWIDERSGRFRVRICHAGEVNSIGTFDTYEEAVKERDIFFTEMFDDVDNSADHMKMRKAEKSAMRKISRETQIFAFGRTICVFLLNDGSVEAGEDRHNVLSRIATRRVICGAIKSGTPTSKK